MYASFFLLRLLKSTEIECRINLGVALARQGKRILLVDADSQTDLTNALGWYNSDDMPVTLASLFKKIENML